jgi:hypothetical protein
MSFMRYLPLRLTLMLSCRFSLPTLDLETLPSLSNALLCFQYSQRLFASFFPRSSRPRFPLSGLATSQVLY